MAINKKLIFWKSSTFNPPTSSTDTTKDVLWNSIVFFDSTAGTYANKIWTHGNFFDGTVTDGHAHTNKANLDSINQNLSTASDVTFESLKVDGIEQLKTQTTTANSVAGYVNFYSKNDGLYQKLSTGVESKLVTTTDLSNYMDLTSKQNVSGLKGFNQGTLVNRTYGLNPTAIRRDAAVLTAWSATTSMIIIELDAVTRADGWMKIKIHNNYTNVAHYLELGLYGSGYNAIYINNTTNANVINMVRWGYNANGKLCIILNDGTLSLSYPEIYVEEFHYNNENAVNNPIVMYFTADISTFTGLQTFPLSHRNAATATTATKLASINTTFTGTYPVAFNVNGNIYSHTGITFAGSTGALTANTFVGNLTGNASSASSATTSNILNVPDTRSVNDAPSDIPNRSITAFFKTASVAQSPPVSTGSIYAHILNMNGYVSGNSGSGGHTTQLAFGDSLAIRQSISVTDWGAWTRLALVTDNVASATKLQTARTIAGVSFDGTANIAIPFANLSDITITSPVANNILKYDGSKWINNTLAQAGIATPTDITNAINELEIGGRNLYIESATIKTYNKGSDSGNASSWGDIVEEGVEFTRLTPKNNGNFYFYPKFHTTPFSIKSGEQYVVSFKYRTTQTSNIGLYNYLLAGGVSAQIPPSLEWQTFSKTYTVTADKTTSSQLFGFASLVAGQNLDIKNLKLEKGNKATDWTPAPEDQVSDWSETDVTSFSYIKNKPTQLSQFTDNIGVGTHIANKTNPHSVTKTQVGLGNVDNTSDANKPVSTAMQTALNLKFDKTGGRLTTGTGDVNIELWRGTNASWNILNSGGYLRFQSNYTTVVGDYFDVLKLDYNTGNALFKGNVTAPTFVGALSGNATSATDLSRSIIAGNGLSGGGVLNADRTITLGTPGTLSNSTTNSVTTASHTHSIDPSDFSVNSLMNTMLTTTTPAVVGSINYGRFHSVNAGNLPVSNNANAILTMSRHTGNYDSQLAFSSNGNIYYRDFSNEVLNNTKVWKTIAFTTNNVASATKLETSRTIWGQSFDGSGNVTGAFSGATTGVFSSTVQATTAILTNLTTSYLPKQTASGLANSIIYDNGTNVGIDTTTVNEKLDIFGNIHLGNGTTGTIRTEKELVLRQDGDVYGSSILRLRNRQNENGAIFETTNPSITLFDFTFKTALNQRTIRYESRSLYASAGAPAFHIGGASANNPSLAVGDTYVAVGNRLSIGSYSYPSYTLDVAGTFNASTSARSPKFDLGNGWDIRAVSDKLQFFQNNIQKVELNSGGFYLDSSVNKSILGKTGTSWYYSLKWEDNDFLIQDYVGTNFIKAAYGSPKKLTILDSLVVQQNGYVGINTEYPQSTLDIMGSVPTIRLSATQGGGINYGIRSGIIGVSNAGFEIYDITNSVSRFTINNGNVGIDNTNPTSKLDVTGTINASSSITASAFYESSDIWLKTNIKELDPSLAANINLVEFDKQDKHGYGVIAQEVEQYYPTLVTEGADGYKAVNYTELAMIKIKYLEDKIKELEGRLNGYRN